jgi:NAD(P)H dehydrogenase (quinone)
MKIGIIVHSHTGNTYSVAQEIKDKLAAAGHNVCLERVSASNEDAAEVGQVQLTGRPCIDEYDALIFGAPVRGFSLSPAMTAYLNQLGSISDKKTACFLTEYFPFPFMGGNQAMKQMKALCGRKGAKVCETGIVNWSNIRRGKMVTDIAERFSSVFHQ